MLFSPLASEYAVCLSLSRSVLCCSSINEHYVHSMVAQMVKRLPAMRETSVQSLGREDPLEKEMATHSSTLAWKIPWMEEPGRLLHGVAKSRTRLSDFIHSFIHRYIDLGHLNSHLGFLNNRRSWGNRHRLLKILSEEIHINLRTLFDP